MESLSGDSNYYITNIDEGHRFYHCSGVFFIDLCGVGDEEPRYMMMEVVYNPLEMLPDFIRNDIKQFVCVLTNFPRRKQWTPAEIAEKKTRELEAKRESSKIAIHELMDISELFGSKTLF